MGRDQSPDSQDRKAHLLHFNHLATVIGKNSTWESKLISCGHRIGPTCKLFHKDPASIPHKTLFMFSPGMVTSVNLYGYRILASDRQVAGSSPMDGVWSSTLESN